MIYKRAVIVGTGLIGGSLALAIKKYRLAKEVVGISRHAKSIAIAVKKGAIDRGSRSLSEARGADLMVLATPVSVVLSQAAALAKIVGKDCVVTDVGSTKLQIVSSLERVFPRFVGSHPLAGSEKRGVANADASLFNGSLCLVTPTRKTDRAALRLVETLWKKAGARVGRMSPAEHDRALAFTSHLPHAAAFSLINAVPGSYLGLAAGGLKDTTRVAGSDAEIWVDIFLSNKTSILSALKAFGRHLGALEKALQRNDVAALEAMFARARVKRSKLGNSH
jgi:prephenate dehydrogenase